MRVKITGLFLLFGFSQLGVLGKGEVNESFESIDVANYIDYIRSKRKESIKKCEKSIVNVVCELKESKSKISTMSMPGYLVSNTGLVLFFSDDFVFGKDEKIKVKIDKKSYDCSFVGYDSFTGLVLCKIDNKTLEELSSKIVPLSLNKSFVDKMYAYKFGVNSSYKKVVKIVSDCNTYESNVFSDFGEHYGLIDIYGNFVGFKTNIRSFGKNKIRYFDLKEEEIIISGIITVDEVNKIISELQVNGFVKRKCAGLDLSSLTKYISTKKGLKVTEGCFVEDIDKNLEKIGIKKGDVIVLFNGYKIKNYSDFVDVFSYMKNKGDLNLTVNRNGEKISFTIDAGVNSCINFSFDKKNKKLVTNGLTFKWDDECCGLKIVGVDNGPFKDKFGDKMKNFIVKKVNDKLVNSIISLKNAIIDICSESEKKYKDNSITFTICGYPQDNKDKKEDVFSVLVEKR